MARWIHKDVARQYDVPENVVRTIYAAVQTAKKQGMYGGQYADFVEREVGRKLRGNEYTVSAAAKQHLNYDPPGGRNYDLKLRGRAKEPARASYNDSQILQAEPILGAANRIIKDVLDRNEHPRFQGHYNSTEVTRGDREALETAALELEVAADLYEGAGAKVRAGTIRERAKLARRVELNALSKYD